MTALERTLYKIEVGESKQIKNVDVLRVDKELFSVDGQEYNVPGVIAAINSKQISPDKECAQRAYILVKPYEPTRAVSLHKVKGKADVAKLVSAALEQGLHLYYTIPRKNERTGEWTAKLPWVLDWDSVPDQDEKTGIQQSRFSCPFCNYPANSSSGRTLHVKTKHPDKVEEYHQQLESAVASVQATVIKRKSIEPDEPDVVDLIGEANSLVCPHCNKECNSSSGLTLHIKNKHGEDKPEKPEGSLQCPHCGKTCSSTSGLTLHIKNKHGGEQNVG